MRIDELNHPLPVLVDVLRTQCGEFLDMCAGKPLYRGMKRFDHDYFINIGPRNRRKNIGDDHLWLEITIDRFLKKKGINALRTNSTFTTPDHDTAQNYGEVFMIFPKDGFEFCYGGTSDIYLDIERWLRNEALYDAEEHGYSEQIQSLLNDCSGDLHIFEVYLQRSRIMRMAFENLYLTRYGFTNRNLQEAISQTYEVWFTGNYHAISVNSDTGQEVCDALGFPKKKY